MSEILIHIGLHKTATTSLQKSVFPNLEGILYHGRQSGSFVGNGDLYEKVCGFCFGSKKYTLNEVRDSISSELTKGRFLISDEWLTSDYDGLFGYKSGRWQKKIERLSSLINGFEHKILLTIREPLE
ncbi:hypothetical protein BZG13_14990, partial [Salinivibrio sp. ML323]|uniref:hypothetical protein n=1 Tax=Salinivibrio sp. ML323 TaxID=1909474 RepID=UPI0009CE956B